MKTLKLNKLATNRLNEKEMRKLTGGIWGWITSYNLTYCYVTAHDCICSAVCSCTFHPPLLDPVASTGNSNSCSTLDPNCLA
jgi:natural product precursor